MKKLHKKLTLTERIIIKTLLKEKRSKSYISIRLNRSRSTVTREVKLWVCNPTDIYDATMAHWHAKFINQTKRAQDKINVYPRLKIFIYRGLLSGTSPELIAGRLNLLYPKDPTMNISHESIYCHIYRHRQSKIGKKLIKLLPVSSSQTTRLSKIWN